MKNDFKLSANYCTKSENFKKNFKIVDRVLVQNDSPTEA